MKTTLIIGIAFVLTASSAQDTNDLTNTYYRITSDFNSDGISDLAISTTLNAFGNTGGIFAFYLGNTNGEYNKVGSIFMHALAANLRPVHDGEGLLTVYVRDGGPGGDLISYSVTKTGIVEKSKRYIRARDGGPEADQQLYQSFFGQNKRLKAELSMADFHGLSLAGAPHHTDSAQLPDLFHAVPAGSLSYEIRPEVRTVYTGLDGTVYHIPNKGIFFVQHDPVGSSTLTFYGPFKGDPRDLMKLPQQKGK